jgi:nitroreductase
MSERRLAIEAPIAAFLALRWSPRAFDAARPIEPDKQLSLFEAARWAPSCFNDQPWRYIAWDKFTTAASWQAALDCLVVANQSWAQRAPLLIAALADSQFRGDGSTNRWGSYDSGAASMSLVLQAVELGLAAHQMGGFDAAKLAQQFSIPERYSPIAMIAVGYPGNLELLDEKRRDMELGARQRRPLAETVFRAHWGHPW